MSNIEKKQYIKRIEFVLTEGMLNPSCHVETVTEFIEDGLSLNSSNHRGVIHCNEGIKMLQEMKVYVYPEEKL